jgi:hypothetical protein
MIKALAVVLVVVGFALGSFTSALRSGRASRKVWLKDAILFLCVALMLGALIAAAVFFQPWRYFL